MHRINDSNIFVEYEEPTIERSHANFSCYPGYELIGHHLAECMGDGKWVPDPQDLRSIAQVLVLLEPLILIK